jgi:hypothetical protein
LRCAETFPTELGLRDVAGYGVHPRMHDLEREMEDARLDVQTLRALPPMPDADARCCRQRA